MGVGSSCTRELAVGETSNSSREQRVATSIAEAKQNIANKKRHQEKVCERVSYFQCAEHLSQSEKDQLIDIERRRSPQTRLAPAVGDLEHYREVTRGSDDDDDDDDSGHRTQPGQLSERMVSVEHYRIVESGELEPPAACSDYCAGHFGPPGRSPSARLLLAPSTALESTGEPCMMLPVFGKEIDVGQDIQWGDAAADKSAAQLDFSVRLATSASTIFPSTTMQSNSTSSNNTHLQASCTMTQDNIHTLLNEVRSKVKTDRRVRFSPGSFFD